MIAINSTPNNIKTNVTLQKTKIRYKIEWIGFFDAITIKLQNKAKRQKTISK